VGWWTVKKIVPRWEWRAFGDEFSEADAFFAAMAPTGIQESDEVYLVSSIPGKVVKVRAGLMDVKSLESVDAAGLEQWVPVLKVGMPLSPEDADRFRATLGLPPRTSDRERYTLDELVAELAELLPELRAVPVHKKRLRYSVGGCMTEMTEVVVEGRRSRTVAVESENADRVVAVVEQLGLSGRANISYPRWLQDAADIEG
jgi:exopolyphosphatase / guanosine-5'-triphosphate,3'-diphosphate pyrophosphatase